MKALMFGWEFPPHILGGLGTASYGLTRGMWECGDMDITFVIPKPFGDEDRSFARIIGNSQVPVAWRDVSRDYVEQRIGNVMDPDLYFRLRDHIYADFTSSKSLSFLMTKINRMMAASAMAIAEKQIKCFCFIISSI